MLGIEDLPDCLFSDECLLIGDLNARHRRLGSSFGSQNSNGLAPWDIVDTYENIQILGNGKPTHVRGGRLVYAIMFNMNEVQAFFRYFV